MRPARRTHSLRRLGAVAQLGERRVRNAEVRGSIPLGSTNQDIDIPYLFIPNANTPCFSSHSGDHMVTTTM